MESTEWTAEEVARAYRESSPALRAALDYLAECPEREVSSLELARAV
jgi:pimeloyl-ACP methyl ester carboxylesterase